MRSNHVGKYLSDSRVLDIVLHYSATDISTDIDIETIDRWHRERGFSEVGYHYYIKRDGTVQTGRDLSKPGHFEVGAHSKGENSASVGICYEGGLLPGDNKTGHDTRTGHQLDAMVVLVDTLMERFPNARVRGHNEMPGAATQCPGFVGSAWWAEVQASRGVVQDRIAATLGVGRRNPRKDVVELQALLKDAGYHLGKIDGDFGPITRGAVLKFQADHGLETDGVVGAATWTALYSHATEPPPRSVTKEDLIADGSRTMTTAKAGKRGAEGFTVAGVGGWFLANAESLTPKLAAAEGVFARGQMLLEQYWSLLLVLAIGALVWWAMARFEWLRLNDAITGKHLGR